MTRFVEREGGRIMDPFGNDIVQVLPDSLASAEYAELVRVVVEALNTRWPDKTAASPPSVVSVAITGPIDPQVNRCR